MSHVTSQNELPSRGELFAAALKRQGYSLQGFARVLAGPDATRQQVDNLRGQVKRWARPDANFTDKTAERLADALGEPPDAFKTPKRARPTLPARVSDLERRLAVLEELVALVREGGDRGLEEVVVRLAVLEARMGLEGPQSTPRVTADPRQADQNHE